MGKEGSSAYSYDARRLVSRPGVKYIQVTGQRERNDVGLAGPDVPHLLVIHTRA
jgi:hypothetical protein